MNKNAVYVLEQPKHSIVSIVLVNSEKLPLSPICHKNIDLLREFSDIFFVFSDKFNNREVNIPKFSNLYGACSYLCGDSTRIGFPIFTAISYCSNVFEKHYAYMITDTDKLGKVDKLEDKKKLLQEIALSGNDSPIFKIDRLGPEELGSIYLTESYADEEDNSEKDNVGIISSLLNFWKKRRKNKEADNIRLWSTHNSSSPILYIKSGTIKNLLNDYETEWFKDYLSSFVEEDLTYIFASYIKKLGLKNIDQSILEINIKGFNNGK